MASRFSTCAHTPGTTSDRCDTYLHSTHGTHCTPSIHCPTLQQREHMCPKLRIHRRTVIYVPPPMDTRRGAGLTPCTLSHFANESRGTCSPKHTQMQPAQTIRIALCEPRADAIVNVVGFLCSIANTNTSNELDCIYCTPPRHNLDRLCRVRHVACY